MADIKELLKKLGFDLTKVEAATDLDAIVTEHNTSQKTHYETILKNDGWKTKTDFDDSVKSHDGKTNGLLNAELKKFGLEAAVIESLTIKEKFAELKKFQETEAGKVDKAGKEEVLELQKENLELKNKVNEFPAELDKAKNEAKTEYLNKQKGDDITIQQKKDFLGIPKESLVSDEHVDGHFELLQMHLSKKYDFDLDDNKDVVYYNKGSKTRPTVSEGGRQSFLTSKEIHIQGLKDLKLYKESNGKGAQGNQQQQQDSGQRQQGKGTKEVSPDMAARLKEMEAAAQKS